MQRLKIVIVGGGISGLTTAFELARWKRERGLAGLDITLVEESGRLGGVIRSAYKDGFLMELGPDSFASEKGAGVGLCEQLGIEQELMNTRSDCRGLSLWDRGRLETVPEGFYMLGHVRPFELLRSRVLSPWGKIRLAFEPWISSPKSMLDESVGQFVKRRFGREVLDRIAQPVLGNIYGSDLNQLSLLAAVPKLRDMELRYGSIAKAIWSVRSRRQTFRRQPRYGMFLSFREGMERLVHKLMRSMPEVHIRESRRVVQIQRKEAWRILLNTGECLEADVVCLAIPSCQAASILEENYSDLSCALNSMEYRNMLSLHVGIRKSALSKPFQQYGFMISPRKASGIQSCSFASNKFAGRSTHDCYLIRIFATDQIAREYIPEHKEQVSNLLWNELRQMLHIQDQAPLLSELMHWTQVIPHYSMGHLDRVARIETLVQKMPSLFLAGNAYGGIGVSDCIRTALKTADAVESYCGFFLKNPSLSSISSHEGF